MQYIKTYNTPTNNYKIYLTRLDQSLIGDDVYSWEAMVYDRNDNRVMSHYFTVDDVRWGGYTVEYMFQRMISDIDSLEGFCL